MKKIIWILCSSFCLFMCACQSKGALGQETSDVTEDIAEAIDQDTEETGADDSASVFVYVTGAVESPGVYELKSGSRIYQAIDAAGGALDGAALDQINLASAVEDGQQISVLYQSEIQAAQAQAQEDASGLLNINTATEEELCNLPGIGESKAQAIISYREENGGFKSIDEITNISGIKDGVFQKIKDSICVN